MTSTPPERTPAQLLQAATVGASYRAARKAVKDAIHTGQLDLEAVLTVGAHGTGDHILGRIQVRHAINAVPAWGPVKIGRLLERLDIDPKTHLDQLTGKERAAIADAIASQQANAARHG